MVKIWKKKICRKDFLGCTVYFCIYTFVFILGTITPLKTFYIFFNSLFLICVFKLLPYQLGNYEITLYAWLLLMILPNYIWRTALKWFFFFFKYLQWNYDFLLLRTWDFVRNELSFVLILLFIILHRNQLVLIWECKLILGFLRNALMCFCLIPKRI